MGRAGEAAGAPESIAADASAFVAGDARAGGPRSGRALKGLDLPRGSGRSTLPAMASYGKLCSEFSDIDKPEAPPDALDYYLAEAERAQGPILEPMCGSGRFLLPLLARGFDVEGCDASPHMLAACRAQAERLGLNPKLSQQPLERLDLERRFGLIYVPSGSFCLLTDPEHVRKCLQRLRAALLPGGRFVVELRVVRPSSVATGAGVG